MGLPRWLAVAGAAAAVATSVAAAAPEDVRRHDRPPLLTDASWRNASSDRAWLASGTVPGADTQWRPMVEQALLDLRALTAANGAVVAGAAPQWWYAWPRDSAFAAAAFARTGHLADAERVLAFLARVQLRDGGFHARYLVDGRGSPDARRRQADGAGWALWALDAVADASGDRPAVAARHRALLHRATAYALRQTDGGTRLPWPSPDYWEVPESRVTLGTVAPLLAGLRASGRLLADLGDPSAPRVARAAETLADVVARRLGPAYERYGASGGADAAVAFLMPPFGVPTAGVVTAWERYQRDAVRPAGGLAPGAGWRADGVSWTPETAVVAFTAAASGRHDVAEAWLLWLDRHRTAWGSLPEKVAADGARGGPAPLAWTAAAVVLTVDALPGP